MPRIEHSDLMKQTVETLLTIIGRRASTSISILLMDTLLKALNDRYSFLKNVTIQTSLYYSDKIDNLVLVDPQVNSVDAEVIGRVIESIIRVVLMDLKEKAGHFFIKELKERLGEPYILALRDCNVDLDLIQLERDYTRAQEIRRIAHHIESENQPYKKPRERTSVINYKWDFVTTWKYENNVCYLYDKQGNLLDKLYLDQIVEDHVRELTEPTPSQRGDESIEIDEQQIKLMKLLYSRDLDMEEAKYFMQQNQLQIESLIYELVKKEFLQHDTYNTVKLTPKGIEYLLSEEEKKLKLAKSV